MTVNGGSVTASSTAEGGNGVRGNVTVSGGSLTASGEDVALAGDLTTTGTVMAGDNAGSATNNTTDCSGGAEISAKYVNVSFGPSATVGAVTVSGTQGTPITGTDVTITLTRDKFKAISAGTSVIDWFAAPPAGLEAKIKTAVALDDTTATITISGTPTAASGAALEITIPVGALATATTESVTVSANAAAKFAIAPAAPAVGEGYTINYSATTIHSPAI